MSHPNTQSIRVSRDGRLTLPTRLLLYFTVNPDAVAGVEPLSEMLDADPELVRRSIKLLHDLRLLERDYRRGPRQGRTLVVTASRDLRKLCAEMRSEK